MTFKRIPNHPDQELLDLLRKCRLIGIHGAMGSGKSSLAKDLISLIGGTHIEVDNHLSTPRMGRTYLQQVKFVDLKSRIQESIPPIFLDCFIVLDVLERINIQADLTLFCERSVNESRWRFNPESETIFESYQTRHHPRTSAKAIFTLVYLN
jgi:ABC-type antimicrobial peptide transport system ATPase subunit